MKKKVQLVCLLMFFASGCGLFVWPHLATSATIEAKDGFRKVLELRESLPQHKAKTFRLPIAGAKKTYSLTASLPAPASLGDGESLTITLRSGPKVVANKTLHAGDPDLYTLFKTAG